MAQFLNWLTSSFDYNNGIISFYLFSLYVSSYLRGLIPISPFQFLILDIKACHLTPNSSLDNVQTGLFKKRHHQTENCESKFCKNMAHKDIFSEKIDYVIRID